MGPRFLIALLIAIVPSMSSSQDTDLMTVEVSPEAAAKLLRAVQSKDGDKEKQESDDDESDETAESDPKPKGEGDSKGGKEGGKKPAQKPKPDSGDEVDPADKSGEATKAGRAQEKHGGRKSSAFERPEGTRQQKNETGKKTLSDIVNSPTRKDEPNRRGGTDVWERPGGRGARFDSDGNFTGFLEPKGSTK